MEKIDKYIKRSALSKKAKVDKHYLSRIFSTGKVGQVVRERIILATEEIVEELIHELYLLRENDNDDRL